VLFCVCVDLAIFKWLRRSTIRRAYLSNRRMQLWR